MRIIFLGDIVGRSGRFAVIKNLKDIIEKKKINYVIINGVLIVVTLSILII